MRRFLAIISWIGFLNGVVGLARNLDDPRLQAPFISIILGLGLTNAVIIGNGFLHWITANRQKAGKPLSKSLRVWSWLFCIGSFGLAGVGWWALLSHWSIGMALDPNRVYLGLLFYTLVTINAFTFLGALQRSESAEMSAPFTPSGDSTERKELSSASSDDLRQLDELRQKGLLTEQEYDVAVARVSKCSN